MGLHRGRLTEMKADVASQRRGRAHAREWLRNLPIHHHTSSGCHTPAPSRQHAGPVHVLSASPTHWTGDPQHHYLPPPVSANQGPPLVYHHQLE